jgi:alkaline phosphatase isozyme conversion protein
MRRRSVNVKTASQSIFTLLWVALLLAGCGASQDVQPVQVTVTMMPPSNPSPIPPTQTPLPGSTQPPSQPPTMLAGTLARQHLAALSETIGPRVVGTLAETAAREYINNAFKALGYTASIQDMNVVAVKPGASSQEIIVGAHYDSVGASKGADDNASGVAVMLEVAARLRDLPTPYTIRFVAFDAEEVGEKGSSDFASHMTPAEIKNTMVMINLDSLIAGEFAYVYGDSGSKYVNWLLSMAAQKGLELKTQLGENPKYPAGTTGDWSDHAPFKSLGIPYLFFESTNWSLGKKDGYTQVEKKYGDNGEIWHTRYDNIEYIEKTFPGRIDQRLSLFVTVLKDFLTEFTN